MPIKPFLTACCLIFAASCATTDNTDTADLNESMVIIGTQMLRMDSGGHIPQRTAYSWAYGISLRNIVTGVARNVALQEGHAVVTLPSGIYCIYTIEPYPTDIYPYCKEPFLKLDPGVVSNAGYFIFAVDLINGKFELYKSAVDGDQLEQALTSGEHDAIDRFKKRYMPQPVP